MRYLALLLFFVSSSAFAIDPALKDIYGKVTGGCVVATDLDEGGGGDVNRTTELTANSLYSVFCYDSATFAGVACKIKQGSSTVDASSGEGSSGEAELLFANEKTMVWVTGSGNNFVSFEPLADGTTQVGVACKRN